MNTFIGFSKKPQKKPEKCEPSMLTHKPMDDQPKPTCNDYRQEMMLLGLRRRLAAEDLSDSEKQAIEAEIEKLEEEMQLS